MNSTSTSRRACPRCLRPLATCFCRLIQGIDNQVELLILQHPEESTNAKNTARLLQLSLKNSQLLIGETFDPEVLQRLINADAKLPLLLYPALADYGSLGIKPPAATPDVSAIQADQIRLVVIDATWRKSRKMLYLNPGLQQLSLFSLKNVPASIYKIRKAHSENQLSTLEASCYALQQLEREAVDYQPLLQAMADFVAQLATFIPQQVTTNRD